MSFDLATKYELQREIAAATARSYGREFSKEELYNTALGPFEKSDESEAVFDETFERFCSCGIVKKGANGKFKVETSFPEDLEAEEEGKGE